MNRILTLTILALYILPFVTSDGKSRWIHSFFNAFKGISNKDPRRSLVDSLINIESKEEIPAKFIPLFQQEYIDKKISEIGEPKHVSWPIIQRFALLSQKDHDNHHLRKVMLIAAEKSINLAFFYLLMRLAFGFLSSLGESINAFASKVSSSSTIGPDLLPYLISNQTTFNHNEKQLLEDLVLPENVDDRWEDIGGLGLLKRDLWMIGEGLNQASNNGSAQSSPKTPLLEPVRSFLLYGPPGCGKTSLVRGFAHRIQWPMLSVAPSSVLRPYVGESSMQLKALFTFISKLKRCILLIDELDSLFSTRAREVKSDSADRQVKTEFMQLWDDLKRRNRNAIIVGMTNRPQDLDPAILRRFERSYRVDLPDFRSRVDIFRRMLRSMRKEPSFDHCKCARLSEGFAASDILELCKSAVARANRRSLSASSMAPSNIAINSTIADTTLNESSNVNFVLRTQVRRYFEFT